MFLAVANGCCTYGRETVAAVSQLNFGVAEPHATIDELIQPVFQALLEICTILMVGMRDKQLKLSYLFARIFSCF